MTKHDPSERARAIANSSTVVDLVILAVVWLAAIFLINPVGEFPLNDDWNFGLAVQQILDDGDFRPPTASSPLLTHALWGSLFCLPTGFSYHSLRFSNQIAGFLAMVFAYMLVRELKGPRLLAVISALSIALNPCFLGLSNSFMTDVTFTAMFTLSSIFYIWGIKSDSNHYILLGTVTSILSILNRQLGLALPLGFGVAYIFKQGFTKTSMVKAIAPAFLCALIYIGFNQWMQLTGRVPVYYDFFRDKAIETLTGGKAILTFLRSSERILLYLGWFLLPVLVLVYGYISLLHHNKQSSGVLWPVTVTTVLAIVTFSLWRSGIDWENGDNLLPRGGGWIYKFGIGPFKLTDTFVLRLNDHLDRIDINYWFLVTCAGLFGTALLLTTGFAFLLGNRRVLFPGKMDSEQAVRLFLLATVVVYLLPVSMINWFDRYLIPTVPLLSAFAAGMIRHERASERSLVMGVCIVFACLAMLGTGFLALAGTRDYFTWNRLRWKIAQELVETEGVEPSEIDGGEEYNSTTIFGPDHRMLPGRSLKELSGGNRRWAITFGDLPGYTPVRAFPYDNWFPRGQRKLYLLERKAVLEPPLQESLDAPSGDLLSPR